MRLIFWVTALAVLTTSYAKNSTTKTKPKRQLENIRTPQNLQYSLVLPHSRVAHFRSISSSRRVSNASQRGGKLPPYAVQMEPVVQYSQKDPLYDPKQDSVVNRNDIAQSKILNVDDQSGEDTYGPPYGSLPTAPLYSNENQHYYEAPEPIIEIIIKESNESLPAPPPQPIQKKKKEPVQVFYVKYSKDPHSNDKVIYEKPIPAITPPSNDEDEHHEQYVTVTPEPYYVPTQTTTLRAIIKPESEIYHSDSNVKISFGNEGRHYVYNRREESPSEKHEETAPRPVIALPNAQPTQIPLERSVSPNPHYQEHLQRPVGIAAPQTYHSGHNAQSRIQFQQPYLSQEPQLPRQRPPLIPFKQEPQLQQNRLNQGTFSSSHNRPAFSNSPPLNHFNSGSPIPGPIGLILPTIARPNNPPAFHSRPVSSAQFPTRTQSNHPSRTTFHNGSQRPYHSQPQPYFDEAKYLQENYHTITTDQVDPSKQQLQPSKQQSFNLGPKPNSNPIVFNEQNRPQQLIPYNQKQTFGITPTRSPFYNLKPAPPQVDINRPFQRQPQQQFSFHQGPQTLKPSPPGPSINNDHNQNIFSSQNAISPSPSPIPQTQFLPQPSSPPLFSFHPQPSPTPHQHGFPSDRPQGQQISQQQDVAQFIPRDSELVPAISKFEQHITVSEPTAQTNYNSGFSGIKQPTPTPSFQQQYSEQFHQEAQIQQQNQFQQQQHEQQQELRRQHHYQQQQQQLQQQQEQRQQQQQQQQQEQRQQQQQQHQQHQQQQQQYQQQQQNQQQQQLQEQAQNEHQYLNSEQEQVRQQLAFNVRKQQEEIQRLQNQLNIQQEHIQHQQRNQYEDNNQYTQEHNSSPSPQYVQERSRPQSNYVTSTASPQYYQAGSRTVEIKPTTQKYVSSTSSPEPKKEAKKKPAIELPDEVPDDLRQQLLSSGILDNADISVLDYDKVGETPLESLPPDQLANFFSAGGGQQIASSEHRPIVVAQNGDRIESRIDDSSDDDQEISASENTESIVAAPNANQGVEMKVVHFNPDTPEGQNIANDYIKEDATQVDPVALNDKKYNRYLPLKVKGNQFPLPDIVKGRKVTSVVVLAPVETEAINNDHSRSERAAGDSLRGIKFVAGDSLQNLLKRPTKDNFEKWFDVEKKTDTDQQSVVLLVTESEDAKEDKEIFMYDISSGTVNKLSGELSNAFVEAAENNSLSKDIERLAIEGEGTPEDFKKDSKSELVAEGSEHVPLFVDISGLSLDQKKGSQVSITSGYSKTKKGRQLRRRT